MILIVEVAGCSKKSQIALPPEPKSPVSSSNDTALNQTFVEKLKMVQKSEKFSHSDMNELSGFVSIQKQWGNDDIVLPEEIDGDPLSENNLQAIAEMIQQEPGTADCELILLKSAERKGFAIVQLQCLSTKVSYYFGRPKSGKWRRLGTTETVY
jgi:hypothetical protein